MSSAAELTTEPRMLELPPGSGGELIDTSPDPRRLAHYLEEFGQRHPATLQGLSPERLAGVLRDRGIQVTGVREIKPTLEDVFVSRIRAGGALA